MTYDPERHHRRSIRLPGYDYTAPGAYFVTLCVQDGVCALGEIVEGQMMPSEESRIVEACWADLPNHYPHVRLDAFVVMPNHVHGIIVLVGEGTVGAGLKPAPTSPYPDATKPVPTAPNGPPRHGLPEIVRALKTFSARRINALRGSPGQPFWQRNYYEHVIRNERELRAIREYIVHNPLRWELDREHPGRSASSKR